MKWTAQLTIEKLNCINSYIWKEKKIFVTKVKSQGICINYISIKKKSAKKMRIKTMRYRDLFIRMAKIQNTSNTKTW